ncbi:hypothetical protein EMCRGX_G026629 [Ephydatia muelleri]
MDQLKKIATFEFDGEDETGDKYEQWSFQMENLFALDGLESVLDLREGASQPSVENSAKVFAKLAVSCTGKALREVRRVPRGDGRVAWLALKNRFASKREERVVALSVEVLSLQWEAYGNLDSFYEAISGRYDKLVATGSDCIPSESLVIAHICKQLPAKYGPIIVKQFSDTKANSIHEFFEHLRLFEVSTKSEEKGSSSGSEASYVVKGKDSGCTRHICATKELFSLLKMFTEKEKKPVVKVANKELVSAAGIVSKSKRQPVNWKARERHTKPGQLIHTDINGPMEVASLKGMRYIVCFIDDATSDNDTVYRDKHFSNFCGSLGIDQRFSAPHTQAQNGVAERFWNTIVDAARTMLHSAKLPKSYWGLAVKHATMLRNVSPSSALSGTTPFECVYGYKPNLATLRKFGSRAYVNTPKDQRKKWDNKARVGIYVGDHEQSKTHLIYMQSTNSIIESMHVKFDEFYDKQHHKDKVQHSSCSIDGNDFEGEKGDQQNQEEERVEQPQEEERVEQPQGEERVEQNQDEERVELPQEEERVDNEENQEVAHRQDDTVGKRELILTRSQALKRGLKLVDLAGGNVKVVNSGEDHQSTDDDGDDISSLSHPYFLDACYIANLPSDPTSLRDALESPQSKEWKKALNEEYQSLVENNTWTLVPASQR